MDETQLQNYLTMFQNYASNPSEVAGADTSVIQNPQTTLQQFQQTPAYQLQYGQNATSANPYTNFTNDPGVQGAIAQGSNALMNNYAARGLSQSTAGADSLTQYMYNNYGSYNSGQANLFNTYQNQLSGLAGLGANESSQLGTQAANAGSTIGTTQSANTQNTSQSLANANLQTGSNISSLEGNQGVLDASAYLNTGAAQANNLFQGNALQAQINSANQSQANAQSNSLLNAQGATNTASSLAGGKF